MGTIRKRGKRWYAEIRRKGRRAAATFDTKLEAQRWMAETEPEVCGRLPVTKTLDDLLDRYSREVSAGKKGKRWEQVRIDRLRRDRIARIRLSELTAPDVVDWRDRRLGEVSAASVRREWTLLSHACTIAVREWHWLKANPFAEVKRPGSPPPRTRRVTPDDLERLALTADYREPPETATQRVYCAFLFACETAMRASEIAGIGPDRVHERHVHIPTSKNGSARDVPLSREARRLLDLVGSDFRLSAMQISSLFRKIRDRAAVDDLHFHDSRREALTRLSKKLDALELARVSGHRDLRILLSTYYAPSVEDLADKLDYT